MAKSNTKIICGVGWEAIIVGIHLIKSIGFLIRIERKKILLANSDRPIEVSQ
jgi:hypothetical protein